MIKFKKIFLIIMFLLLGLTQIAYANPNFEDDEIPNLRAPIKNLANISRTKILSDVLEFLIKENVPTLKPNCHHKNFSLKETTGEIQYYLAYISLMEAFIAPVCKKKKYLKKACKWNQNAALNGNGDAKKLSEMVLELVPIQKNYFPQIEIEAL